MLVQLVSVDRLIPHEKIDFSLGNILARKILLEKIWSNPIIVDKDNFIIMDGHHRKYAANILNLKRIPCIMVSYKSNQVQVYNFNSCKPFSYQDILDIVKRNDLFPKKTTRHVLNFNYEYISIPLEILKDF